MGTPQTIRVDQLQHHRYRVERRNVMPLLKAYWAADLNRHHNPDIINEPFDQVARYLAVEEDVTWELISREAHWQDVYGSGPPCLKPSLACCR